MRLHHIGYLVADIKKALRSFSDLGFKTVRYENGDEIMFDGHRKCYISFVGNKKIQRRNKG